MEGRPQFPAKRGQRFLVGLKSGEIAGAGGCGIDVEGAAGFSVLEKGRSGEIKGEFGGVEHLEEDGFVAGRGQGNEMAFQFIERGQKVGNDHHEGALPHNFRDALDRLDEIGGRAARRPVEGDDDLPQMAHPLTGREVVAQGVIKAEQSDGIALEVKEPGEGGGEGGGIRRLGPPKGTEIHGVALVHQEMAAEVGFVLELPDVIPVAPGINAPVEMAGVVAGGVLAVFGELDGETMIGTAVQAGPETLDHRAGTQLQAADAHERGRINPRRRRRSRGVGGGRQGGHGGKDRPYGANRTYRAYFL